MQINNAMQPKIETGSFEDLIRAPAFREEPTIKKWEVVYIAFHTCIDARKPFVDPHYQLADGNEYSYALSWPDFMNTLAARNDIQCTAVLVDERWSDYYPQSTFAKYKETEGKDSNIHKAKFHFIHTPIEVISYLQLYILEKLREGAVIIVGAYNDTPTHGRSASENSKSSSIDAIKKLYNSILKEYAYTRHRIALLSDQQNIIIPKGTTRECAALWWNGNNFNEKETYILNRWIEGLFFDAKKFALWKSPIKEDTLMHPSEKETKTLTQAKSDFRALLYNPETLKMSMRSRLNKDAALQEILNQSPEKLSCTFVTLTAIPGSKIPVLRLGISMQEDNLLIDMPKIEPFNFLDFKRYYLDTFRAWDLPEDLLTQSLALPLRELNKDLQALSQLGLI